MDVERFFLGVVFDRVSPEFTADTGLAIATEWKLRISRLHTLAERP
jgi:hypothetical protein